MNALSHYILLAFAALVASTLAAVSGFGGAAILLPPLTLVYGIRLAVPILTVAQLIGNASRAFLNRKELDWRVVGWFALGGVPMALVGSILFAHVPLRALTRLLGAFLILLVVLRHSAGASRWKPPLRSFTLLGACFSLLSALLGSVGPLMAPFFLAYGLVKNAYIGTEALATVTMHVTKLVAYRQLALLPARAVLTGLALGPSMILGSYVGKFILHRLPVWLFVRIVDLTLVAAGFLFLFQRPHAG